MYLKVAIFRQNTGKNILTSCSQNDDVIISYMSKASVEIAEKPTVEAQFPSLQTHARTHAHTSYLRVPTDHMKSTQNTAAPASPQVPQNTNCPKNNLHKNLSAAFKAHKKSVQCDGQHASGWAGG